ncbi:MAG: hypothetical protein JRH10_11695 [Deltaproteobacteria bacterium]|nr:hypothetical protein [Deltaproteobacteria bacterium]
MGNLFIGYNELPGDFECTDRLGSHNLVVGREHRYPSFGGLVAGFRNSVSGEEATVSGGAGLVAAGPDIHVP